MKSSIRLIGFTLATGIALCSPCLFAQNKTANKTTSNQQRPSNTESQPIYLDYSKLRLRHDRFGHVRQRNR